jgi:hypothetical protein
VATKTERAILRTDAAKTQGSRRKVQCYEVLRGSMHAKPWPMAEVGTMVQFASYEVIYVARLKLLYMGFGRDVKRSGAGAEVPAPSAEGPHQSVQLPPECRKPHLSRRGRRPFFYIQDVVPRLNIWANSGAMICCREEFSVIEVSSSVLSPWLPGHPNDITCLEPNSNFILDHP